MYVYIYICIYVYHLTESLIMTRQDISVCKVRVEERKNYEVKFNEIVLKLINSYNK